MIIRGITNIEANVYRTCFLALREQSVTLFEIFAMLPCNRAWFGNINCVKKILVAWWGQRLLFSCSVVSNSLQPHELQHASLPCPSTSPRACSNSCPLSQWCHPTISSSVALFSSCTQFFLALGSFPMSQLFASGDLSIGASTSASVLPTNIQS